MSNNIPVTPASANPNVGTDTYAIYDSNWKLGSSNGVTVSPVSSVIAKPGYTWVSLSWTPAGGGLNILNGECGYVVYRSSAHAPTTFADPNVDPNAQIVYVGTETYFGDMPLSENTSGLLTADMGLAQGTTYYYSVFVVTTIPAGFTSGYYSEPFSIEVTTLTGSPENLITNSAFADPLSAWKIGTATGFSATSADASKDPWQDILYTPAQGTYLHVTTPSPTKSQKVQGSIYQTITLKEGLIPGKLYSYTFWYRSDNPVTMESYSADKQTYTPYVSVFGGSSVTQSTTTYDVFQATQSIHSETSNGYSPNTNGGSPTKSCTFSDDTGGIRYAQYQTQTSINYNYNNQNIMGFWTQGGGSFVIGIPGASATRLPYNDKGQGGDPVQMYNQYPKLTTGTLGSDLTLVIDIIPALSDPSIPTSTNSDFVGHIDLADFQLVEGLPAVTDFFFSFQLNKPSVAALPPLVTPPNLIQNPSFDGIYSRTLGAISPPWIFTAASVPDLTGIKPPVCTPQVGSTAANCPCPAPKNLIPCGSPGYRDANGNYQKWASLDTVETCSGAALCFNDPKDPRYNGNDLPPFCPQSKVAGVPDSYMVLIGSCCSTQEVQLLNIYNYALAPDQNYTFNMSYMLLSVGSFNATISENSSTSCQANCTGNKALSPELTMSVAINDGVGKGNTLNNQTDQVVKLGGAVATSWSTYSTTFSVAKPVNIQIIVGLPSCNADGYMVAIKDFSLTALGNETYGLQDPFPTIPTVPYTRNIPNNSIVWKMPNPDTSQTIESQLLHQTAYFGTNTASTITPGVAPTDVTTLIGSSQGLVLYNNFHTVPSDCPDFVSIKPDANTYGPIKAKLNDLEVTNILSLTQTNFMTPFDTSIKNPNTSAFVISNAYYGSGQWDAWIRLAEVTDGSGTPIKYTDGNAALPNPLGSSLAFWIFHYYDNVIVGGSRLLLDSQTIHNTEIDIEMNGDCPENSNCFSTDIQVGRLNGWGGQWGCGSGCGSNFTMHTLTPQDPNNPGKGIRLNDGLYHKLSFVYHSGVDLTPDLIDPNNANQPQTRLPGFIKWFIDDIEWGSGWVGNQYGFDNIPMTATRIYLGPWDPDWSGGNVGCMPSYYSKYTTGGYPVSCSTDGPDGKAVAGFTPDRPGGPTSCQTITPIGANGTPAFQCAKSSVQGCPRTPQLDGGYTLWSTATWNVAMMQFTPINLDNPDHTIPPYNKGLYPKAVDANGNIVPANAPPGLEKIGASNRNHFVPETGGWQVFPVGGSRAGTCS
jgi:hypothetical protein